MVEVKITKVDERALEPFCATQGSAGYDLHCIEPFSICAGDVAVIRTGLAIKLPDGYEAQIRSRSGLATKGIFVLNAPGTIDSDYTGEIKVIIANFGKFGYSALAGSRIAQMVISEYAKCQFVNVDALDDTERGDKGFGSTGQ